MGDSNKTAQATAEFKLFKVVSKQKLRVPAPVIELQVGANHFEIADEEYARPLLEHLAKLLRAEEPLIMVQILDSEANATDWESPNS